jgi:hypothetical protein
MGNARRAAEANVGAFYSGVVQISLPIPAIGVEPESGELRPEDEWKVPTGPLDAQDGVSPEQVRSEGSVIVPPNRTDKR